MDDLSASWKAVILVGGVVGIVISVRLLQAVLSARLREHESRYRVRKIASLLGYVVAAALAAVLFRSDVGNLSVALGVAGAGIAFALQEVIASFAGWFAISFAGFYRTGDRVQLGGIRGDVIDIGLLRTTLMEMGEWVQSDEYTGRVVRIANSFVFKEPVFNYSGDFPFVWDEVAIPVKHGSDHVLARQLLEQVAHDVVGENGPRVEKAWSQMVNKYRIERAILEPRVTLVVTDNWMEFTLRYVVDFRSRRTTRDRIYTAVLDVFSTTDGKVEVGSTTLHVVDVPDLSVRWDDRGPGQPRG